MVTEVVIAIIMMVITGTEVTAVTAMDIETGTDITVVTIMAAEAMVVTTVVTTTGVTMVVITVDITGHTMAVITATAPAMDAMDPDTDTAIRVMGMAIRQGMVVTVPTVTDTILRIIDPIRISISGSASFIEVKPGPPRRTGA